MEKNSRSKFTHKNKIILLAMAIVFMLSFVVAMGLFLTKAPIVKYTVEYIKDSDDVLVQTYYKGEKISFPEAPEKKGYLFVGWSLDKEQEKLVTHDIIVDKELTLYAKWEEAVYTLIYNDKNYIVSYNAYFRVENDNLIITDNDEIIELSAPQIEFKNVDTWCVKINNDYININDFSLKNLSHTIFHVEPKYVDEIVEYQVIGDIENISVIDGALSGTISKGSELYFEFQLHDCVNKSIPSVISSSGEVVLSLTSDTYIVKVKNFTNNFNIIIDNIEVNSYTINFNNNGELSFVEVTHGENLTIPTFINKGYDFVGVKDIEGRFYSSEYIVTSDLNLIVVWKLSVYTITFPRSNGQYVFICNNEYITSEKTINVTYHETIALDLVLSDAYSNSNVILYGKNNNNVIYPEYSENQYFFNCVEQDFNIVVDNIMLNTYLLKVDGVEYGDFSFGSWVCVEDESVVVKDIANNKTICIDKIYDDKSFGGWYLNNEKILINNLIQDISINGVVEVFGKYSGKVAKIHFISNGGNLETTELIYIENQDFKMPIPTKQGYKFAGWYVKLVEVNTQVDDVQSVKFAQITDTYMVLYAGWIKE